MTRQPYTTCPPAYRIEYVWTGTEADHGGPARSGTATYLYIGYIMLHEFGHTLGLPDFYALPAQPSTPGMPTPTPLPHPSTNYDPRLDIETAIMNLPWDAVNIQQEDRDQLDAIYRTHTRHR